MNSITTHSNTIFSNFKAPSLNSFIALGKVATALFITSLIYIYQAFTVVSFIYLAMYTSYALCWILKVLVFPNKNFNKTINLQDMITSVPLLFGIYWLIPWLAISNVEPSNVEIIFVSLVLFIVGLVIMMVADSQTFFMLRENPNQLITGGMNKYLRHPNYLGELLLYSSFALLSRKLLSFILLAMVFGFIFIPLNLAKEESLTRYAEFEQWKRRTGMYFPNVYSFVEIEGINEDIKYAQVKEEETKNQKEEENEEISRCD